MADIPLLDKIFANDGFWPDVPARPAIEAYRLQPDGRTEMVRTLILEAIVETNSSLRYARQAVRAAGHQSLEDWDEAFPDLTVDDAPIADQLYLSAVYSLAKARAVRRLAATARAPATADQGAGTDATEAGFLDQHQNALGQLLALLTGSGARDFGVYMALL